MKRLALAALLVAAGLASPASAQYYGPGPGYGGGGGGYGGGGGGYGGGGYGGGYDPGPRRPRYDDDYDYRRGPPPPRRGSAICVTSRGNCPIGRFVPRNSPCGCEVPGFGFKRGAAG